MTLPEPQKKVSNEEIAYITACKLLKIPVNSSRGAGKVTAKLYAKHIKEALDTKDSELSTSNAKWKERLGQLKEALELAKYSIRGPLPDQYEEGEHDSDFKEDVALAKDAYKKTCEALQTLHKLLEGEG